MKKEKPRIFLPRVKANSPLTFLENWPSLASPQMKGTSSLCYCKWLLVVPPPLIFRANIYTMLTMCQALFQAFYMRYLM